MGRRIAKGVAVAFPRGISERSAAEILEELL